MNYRANAAVAIGKRRLTESLIHPGFYAALTAGLAVGYALTAGFVHSIDSSGFDYNLNPGYNLIGGILSGAFGAPFVARLFAGGPSVFALHLAFLPVLLYLSMTSVYRFGSEKSSGAIELLCYGPSDGTSYFLGSLIKDAVLTAIALVALLLFFAVAGLIDNLAMPTTFLVSLVLLFVGSLCVYGYGVLMSVSTDSANTALALFIAGLLLFGLSLLGSQAIVTGYVQSLSMVAAWIIKWFSPFFYWSTSMKAQASNEIGLFVAGLIGQVALTAVILVVSHYIVKSRGVRP